jgi:hypothetical protein
MFFRRMFFYLFVPFPALFGSDWEIVYLASFMRSGNHWVRYLIEEATGIATSSLHQDNNPPHLPKLFPWDGYAADHGYEGTRRYPEKGEPVVIKTHYPVPGVPSLPHLAQTVICLIRNPIDALYSWYAYTSRKAKRIGQQIPTEYLHFHIEQWRAFYEYWEKQDHVIIIRYEDLYRDPISSLTKIIQATGYSVRPEDIRRAVSKYPPIGGILKHLHHYAKEDVDFIRQELMDLLLRYGYEF